jgi:hypothetical protein
MVGASKRDVGNTRGAKLDKNKLGLKMLNIMSKEAKKYIGNIGVENNFYKFFSNHEGS